MRCIVRLVAAGMGPWLGLLCCTASAADGVPAAEAAAASAAVLPAVRLRPLPEPERGARTEDPAFAPVSIVELPRLGIPNDGTPGSQRAHHALSLRSDGPTRMLRSMGMDAADCATRFRMPSKLKQERGGAVNVEVQAQIGLSCRF